MNQSPGECWTELPPLFFVLGALAAIAPACSSSDSTAKNAGESDDGGPSTSSEAGGATANDAAPGANGNDGSTSARDSGATIPDGGPALTTIRVHYPAGAHAITLRGSALPLNWDAGVALTASANGTWTFTSTQITAPLELKPLLDDTAWSLGPNFKASPGAAVDIYPRFTQVAGTWSRAYDFASATLGNTRGIWIYLPPTYIENSLAQMPVLYMHDGQNLFDPTVAFGGNAWNVGQTMDAGAADGSIAEAIVIGIENTADRINEYTPVADPTDGGGKGDLYLKMIISELKPKIDAEMRTLPDRAHTTMVGSSLGGLITSYAGVTHADVFGAVGIMSPSTWWDNDWLIGEVGKTAMPRPVRVYVDSGDSGDSNDDVTETKSLADEYRTIGFVDGASLDYLVQAGGQHNEIYWAQRLPGALKFLLGPGR